MASAEVSRILEWRGKPLFMGPDNEYEVALQIDVEAAGKHGISGRRIDVVLCMAAGDASRGLIGERLGISPRTASTHLSNIYNVLHIKEPTQVVAFLICAKVLRYI